MNTNQPQTIAAIARVELDHVIKIICGHEFNTPMATILGLAEMLHKDRADMTNSELNEYIGYILESGFRLNNVSKRLGTWYALSKNSFIQKIPFRIDFTTLLLIIDEQKELYKDKTPQKLINISSSGETLELTGDRFYFLQAFTELINNAFKFSLANTLVHFSFTVYDNELIIRIVNLSDMVSEYQLKEYHVFTQFNRHKFEQQGLGIGLEIAKLGTEQCGGRFTISGRDNYGLCEIVTCISLPFRINQPA